MVRAPCCDHKLGLKKGPWTTEEDQILISFVQNNGHPNWRALPKQAGNFPKLSHLWGFLHYPIKYENNFGFCLMFFSST